MKADDTLLHGKKQSRYCAWTRIAPERKEVVSSNVPPIAQGLLFIR
jgi:hypothetical protein